MLDFNANDENLEGPKEQDERGEGEARHGLLKQSRDQRVGRTCSHKLEGTKPDIYDKQSEATEIQCDLLHE